MTNAGVDGMRYREDDFEGRALSGRHVFCPQPDEAPHVVGKVGEPDLHAGLGKADRADCQIEQTLLMRKHMFDGAANLRLLRIGKAGALRHGLALRLLAVKPIPDM